MIFNQDVIFIHIGKTGGMSCAAYLLKTLQTPIYNCHFEAEEETKALGIPGVIPRTDVHRHCTLAEALNYIEKFSGKTLADFKRVFAVIRHPYALELSFYKHLQKPEVKMRRRKDARLLALATGSFEEFVKSGCYHREDHRQEDFFRLGRALPPSLHLVRFEGLPLSFIDAVEPYRHSPSVASFPRLNASPGASDALVPITAELLQAVYKKHRFMFDQGYYSIAEGCFGP